MGRKCKVDLMELLFKKWTSFYCENGHLYCVSVVDIYRYQLQMITDVEFAREQGKVKTGDPVECNVCKGRIKWGG